MGGSIIWRLVEWDPQPDDDLVAGDAYFFNHEPHQFLTLFEAEFVHGTTYPACEAGDSTAKPILLREHAALFNQRLSLFFKSVATGVDLPGATLDFGQLK